MDTTMAARIAAAGAGAGRGSRAPHHSRPRDRRLFGVRPDEHAPPGVASRVVPRGRAGADGRAEWSGKAATAPISATACSFWSRPGIRRRCSASWCRTVLTTALGEHNSGHRLPERIRLRVALHAGEVSYDDHGTTGAAIVHTFRLLQSRVLRDAFACAAGDLAVIASAWFYDEIIRHSPVSRPDRFRSVLVQEKETAARGWIRLLGPEEGENGGWPNDHAVG